MHTWYLSAYRAHLWEWALIKHKMHSCTHTYTHAQATHSSSLELWLGRDLGVFLVMLLSDVFQIRRYITFIFSAKLYPCVACLSNSKAPLNPADICPDRPGLSFTVRVLRGFLFILGKQFPLCFVLALVYCRQLKSLWFRTLAPISECYWRGGNRVDYEKSTLRWYHFWADCWGFNNMWGLTICSLSWQSSE